MFRKETTMTSRLFFVALTMSAAVLSWAEADKPKFERQPVEIQVDLKIEKFYKMFVDLLTWPTPANR